MKAEASSKYTQNTHSARSQVLFIVGDFPPTFGGLPDYAALFVEGLASLGRCVTVLTTKVKGQKDRTLRQGVDIRRLISDWRLPEISSILAVIDEMGPDTIVNLMHGGFAMSRRPMVTLLPLFLRLLRPQCRVIVTIHEFRTQRTRRRIWAIPMIMAAHGLIFVDRPDQEHLLRWTKLKRPKMECIPIAPNILPVPATESQRRAWRRRLDILEDTPIVTFFGGISRQKGFLDLLEAMNELRRDAIPAYLLIVGWFDPGYAGNWGYEHEVREALKDGLSAGWIKFVESCPPDTVSEYLHASDVVVLPFVRGARSNNGSLLAAVAHGLPVITTRGVDTPEGFAEEYGVALVPAGDAVSLGTRLKQIILSAEEKSRLKTEALRAARIFSWASNACITAAFYDSFGVEPATECVIDGART